MKIIPLLFLAVLILLVLLSGLYRPIGKVVSRLFGDAARAVMDDEDENTNSNRKDEHN